MKRASARRTGTHHRKALEKDRKLRYQTASDLRTDLARLKRDTDRAALPSAPPAPPVADGWKAKVALAVVALAIAAGAAYFVLRPRTETGARPRDISFMQLTDQAGPETFPSLSPDGKSLVYAARASATWDIYLQRVGGKNPDKPDQRFFRR